MQPYFPPQLYKRMPFVRLLVPFVAGILLQWYLPLPLLPLLVAFSFSIGCFVLLSLVKLTWLYRLRWLQGVLLHIALMAAGCMVVHHQDVRNNPHWLGVHYQAGLPILATVQEPLVEKNKSYKAEAKVEAIKTTAGWQEVEGSIIIYIKKDSIQTAIGYGTQLIFQKSLQSIKNSGNPGAFDYARYNLFREISYQVYLKPEEFAIAQTTGGSYFQGWLLSVKHWVIATLKHRVPGDEESSVAEALLVGYRNDLDKDLVQAYSNTGVVHIIAISGLHLGMIYVLMGWLLKPLKKKRAGRIGWAIIMFIVLWLFALVAGAAPSIVRSAVMFTFIILGEAFNRKGSIYNTLAGAAFLMLLYNPFFLWDVGFQLSFGAVVSIVTFMQPIYKWLYFKNKAFDKLWQLSAVTLSAQVITAPLILYYFHQFPLLFMITNFVAVPLSTLILYLELALMLMAPVELFAVGIGKLTSWCIYGLNSFIKHVNELPFAVYDNVQLNLLQSFLLLGIIICVCHWLMRKKTTSLIGGMFILLLWTAEESWQTVQVQNKDQVIVYNIPQHQAMDFAEGCNYSFIGDNTVSSDPFLHNFHLKPARNYLRLQDDDTPTNTAYQYPFVCFNNKTILLIDRPLRFSCSTQVPVDLIVISKNPKVYMKDLQQTFDCKQYVFDGSNPQWKIKLWKRDCDSLKMKYYITEERGAFVMEL